MQNPRYLAFKALYKVEAENSYSNLILDSMLKSSDLDRRAAAFASALFYGVLEKKLSLDYIISKFSSVRLKKIEPKTLIILRLGIFQMVFMDKVPDSAAVNESVKIAKKEKLYQSSGFVNGVLRSISRAENKFPLPDKSDHVKYLSVKYSVPEDIIRLWADDYSIATAEETAKSLSGRPPIYARVNTLKTTRSELIERLKAENVTAKETECSLNAIELTDSGSLSELSSFKEGLFHIQDLASQICCEILGAKKGEVVSDVCSAPGGKAFSIAQSMENCGKVNCFDIHEHKIKLIKSGAKRLGIGIISAEVRDAESGSPIEMSDRILCDVPCSGLGILRRKPEIRYKTDTGISTLPEIQYKILCNSARFLKSGGVIIYSTCTLHREENGGVADRFLKENPDFEPLPINLPSGITRTIDEPQNQLTLFPQNGNTDGFFICAMKKR